MLGKRPTWMIKAVAVSLIGLVIAGAYIVGVVWLYGRVEPIAPDWMIRSGIRSWSLLSMAAVFGCFFGLTMIGTLVVTVLVRVVRVPVEVIAPSTSAPDYPEHLRPPSPAASARPGREGFMDDTIRRWTD